MAGDEFSGVEQQLLQLLGIDGPQARRWWATRGADRRDVAFPRTCLGGNGLHQALSGAGGSGKCSFP